MTTLNLSTVLALNAKRDKQQKKGRFDDALLDLGISFEKKRTKNKKK